MWRHRRHWSFLLSGVNEPRRKRFGVKIWPGARRNMLTPERCRENADEAERLARAVSYARDRERLLGQAAVWRSKADALEAAPPPAPPKRAKRCGLLRWLRRPRRG